MKVMAILGSARRDGNSEYLVDKSLKGLEHNKVSLLDKQFKPIVDERHVEKGFTEVSDGYEDLFAEFLQQDIWVFATPLYWFGMSGQMKIFFDRWSQYMHDQRFQFNEQMKGKKAYVIIVGENPHPRTAALPLIQQFQAIFEYSGIEFSDYIIGKGNRVGSIMQDEMALAKADFWNKQFSKESSSIS